MPLCTSYFAKKIPQIVHHQSAIDGKVYIRMETDIMEKENKVSLWLGFYENADDIKRYIKVSYDEDGNYIPSNFQETYAIKKYDLDALESDWISEQCSDVELLLAGFSGDYEIIPQLKKY